MKIPERLYNLNTRELILSIVLAGVIGWTLGWKTGEFLFGPEDYDETAIHVTESYKDIMYQSSYKIITKAKLKINRWGFESIEDVESSGSGVVIRDDHGRLYLITCHHVLDFSYANKSVEVLESSHYMDYNGKKLKLQIEFSDKKHDVALVKTEKAVTNYSGTVIDKFATAKYMRPGDVAYVVGFPGGLERSMTRGIISAMEHTFDYKLIPQNVMLANVDITGGSSGGGLFLLEDGYPRLAGITQFSLGLNGIFGYKLINHIRKSFDAHDYGYMLD